MQTSTRNGARKLSAPAVSVATGNRVVRVTESKSSSGLSEYLFHTDDVRQFSDSEISADDNSIPIRSVAKRFGIAIKRAKSYKNILKVRNLGDYFSLVSFQEQVSDSDLSTTPEESALSSTFLETQRNHHGSRQSVSNKPVRPSAGNPQTGVIVTLRKARNGHLAVRVCPPQLDDYSDLSDSEEPPNELVSRAVNSPQAKRRKEFPGAPPATYNAMLDGKKKWTRTVWEQADMGLVDPSSAASTVSKPFHPPASTNTATPVQTTPQSFAEQLRLLLAKNNINAEQFVRVLSASTSLPSPSTGPTTGSSSSSLVPRYAYVTRSSNAAASVPPLNQSELAIDHHFPKFPSWFQEDRVHDLEISHFSKFIPMEDEKNLKIYWEIREEVRKLYLFKLSKSSDKTTYLSANETRINMHMQDDASLVFEVWNFLAKNNLINFSVSPDQVPVTNHYQQKELVFPYASSLTPSPPPITSSPECAICGASLPFIVFIEGNDRRNVYCSICSVQKGISETSEITEEGKMSALPVNLFLGNDSVLLRLQENPEISWEELASEIGESKDRLVFDLLTLPLFEGRKSETSENIHYEHEETRRLVEELKELMNSRFSGKFTISSNLETAVVDEDEDEKKIRGSAVAEATVLSMFSSPTLEDRIIYDLVRSVPIGVLIKELARIVDEAVNSYSKSMLTDETDDIQSVLASLLKSMHRAGIKILEEERHLAASFVGRLCHSISQKLKTKLGTVEVLDRKCDEFRSRGTANGHIVDHTEANDKVIQRVNYISEDERRLLISTIRKIKEL